MNDVLDFFSLADNLTSSFGAAASTGIGALSYLSGTKAAYGMASSLAKDSDQPFEDRLLGMFGGFFGAGALLSPSFMAAAAQGSVAGTAPMPALQPAQLAPFMAPAP